MRSRLLPFLLLAPSGAAFGAPHVLRVTDPIPLWLSDVEEDSVPPGYTEEALRAAIAKFDAVTCPTFGFEVMGTAENTSARDGENHVVVDDPSGYLSVGVYGAALVYYSEDDVQRGGVTFDVADELDLVLNDKVEFGTEEDVLAETCVDTLSLEGVFLDILMYAVGITPEESRLECTAAGEIPEWALQDVGYAYGGGHPTISCVPALVAPGDQVTCSVVGANADEAVSWSWSGNGATSEAPVFSTMFDSAGTKDFEGCFEGEGSCGPWSGCDGVDVVVCDGPVVDLRYDVVDGAVEATVLALDEEPLCRPKAYAWSLFDGEGQLAASGDQDSFSAPVDVGSWRLVLTVSNDVAEATLEETFDVAEDVGDTDDTDVADTDAGDTDDGGDYVAGPCGCATTSPALPVAFLPLLAIRRRRR